MASSKNYYSVKANSLLESVIALCIITICLYLASMVYAAIFTANTTSRFYMSRNKMDEAFFLMQTDQDSLLEKYENDRWKIEKEYYGGAERLIITYRDSLQIYPLKRYYISQ